MATSVFFNQFDSYAEQRLIEDLIVESIRIYGHDVYYLPRTIVNFDDVYGEDSSSEYNNAFFVEMYIKNIDGFGGQGDFASKFGMQIRDEMTLSMARLVFDEEIGQYTELERPREGDIIYFPLNRKLFQIKFVEHEPIFYQFGALQVYDLKVELFEYSNERFNTGIKEIDIIERGYSTSSAIASILDNGNNVITDSDGFPLISSSYNEEEDGDIFTDSPEIESEANTYIDFSETNPFGSV